MSPEQNLRDRHPYIAWDKPVQVTTDTATGWACRYCIALYGLLGANVDGLEKDASAVVAHIRAFHH